MAATALVLAAYGYRVVVNHHTSASQAEEVVATIAAAGGEAWASHVGRRSGPTPVCRPSSQQSADGLGLVRVHGDLDLFVLAA